MGLEKIKKLLSDHKKIAIDTVVMIYFLERNKSYYKYAEAVFLLAEKNKIEIYLSVLVSLEFLTGAYKANRQDVIFDYNRFINSFPNMHLINIDSKIADLAAFLRAKYKIKTPDSIHLASAINSGAKIFITNDKKLLTITEISVICLNQ